MVMSLNEKFTALADEVRELSGTNTSKGIDDMTSDINSVNTAINEQDGLLMQLFTVIDSLPAAGSPETRPTLFPSTITVNGVSSELAITDNQNGGFVPWYDIYVDDQYIATVVDKKTMLADYLEHTQTMNVKVRSQLTNFNSIDSNIVEWIKYENNAGTIGLKYSVASDQTYASCTGIGTATDTNIMIADVYQNTPVTKVAGSAFYNNTSLISVVIPDSVTFIGGYAFYGCTNLTSIVIGKRVNQLGSGSDGVFYHCSNLQDIYITDLAAWVNIKNMNQLGSAGSSAKNFYINNKLVTELVLPDNITSISDYALKSLNLNKIVVSNSVISIGNYVFSSSPVTNVIVGSSVSSIGARAFYYCGNLTQVDMSACTSIPTIASDTFDTYNSSWLEIKVPDELYEDYKSATNWSKFALCIVIKFATPGLKYTSTSGTYYCNGRDTATEADIVISRKASVIGTSAFRNDLNLTSVSIPESITSIYGNAFDGCSNLKRVEFMKHKQVPSISSTSFINTPDDLQIKVPANMLDEWKSASSNWTAFADKIVTEFTNEI